MVLNMQVHQIETAERLFLGEEMASVMPKLGTLVTYSNCSGTRFESCFCSNRGRLQCQRRWSVREVPMAQ